MSSPASQRLLVLDDAFPNVEEGSFANVVAVLHAIYEDGGLPSVVITHRPQLAAAVDGEDAS